MNKKYYEVTVEALVQRTVMVEAETLLMLRMRLVER